MFNSLDDILQQECKLDRKLPVLVGVSGGPDSICLLHYLMQAGYPVIVAHFNHQLRSEATAEAEQVHQLVQSWNVKSIIENGDVRTHSEKHHLSIEEAARELRYQFLFRTAIKEGAQAVAVGHNADDQVETVLMHLLRGAGPAGLRGMRWCSFPNPWSRELPLLRPLLGVWRNEIEAYIQTYNLPIIQDLSNLDPIYFRNRLRHQAIPYLQTLNPQIKQALWQTAELVGLEYDFLTAEVDRKWESITAWDKAGVIGFRRDIFSALEPGLQRELLRRAILKIQPDLRDLDYAAIQRAFQAIQSSEQYSQIDLLAGLRLLGEPDRIWLCGPGVELPGEEWPQMETGNEIALEPSSEYLLTNGWKLQVRIVALNVEQKASILENNDPYQAWVDVGQLTSPLSMRTRLPGDRIQILGMDGRHTKLSDLFINRKIPRRARSNWPLITSGEEIIWVPGVQVAHPVRLSIQTQQAIHFSFSHT